MSTPPFVFCPRYEADIGPHVFPVEKYRLVRESLLDGKAVTGDAFASPPDPDPRLPGLVHTPAYLEDLRELRKSAATVSSELPLTREIVTWFEWAVSGTVLTTELALGRGAAMHLGGGFHHAFADHAEGFCYLNDTAVAARVALGDGPEPPARPVASVTVVDLDVHQGNGTARIFQDDPRVFTFSMHQENNYPMKERGNLDLGLADGVRDAEYLDGLERGLDVSVRRRRPELVYYLAGADPYERDQLGGLGLSLSGMRERDRRVFAACREVEAPVAVLLAGGYALNLEDTVRIHAGTGLELLERWPWSPDAR